MRSARSFSCALVLVALVSAACSSSSGDDAGGGDDANETAAQTDATTYVDGVCTALSDWQSGMEAGNDALESTLSGGQPTPEDTKNALVGFLSATVEGTQTMVTDIADLGVPDVDGGEEIASTLSSEEWGAKLGRALAATADGRKPTPYRLTIPVRVRP